MKAIFLSPHNDDESLFGAFTLLRYQPLVIVCFKSVIQELRGTGITSDRREQETDNALSELGVFEWRQWEHLDTLSYEAAIETLRPSLRQLADEFPDAHVWMPAFEDGGHDQHNAVSHADAFWPYAQIHMYLTYKRGMDRTYGERVEFEPHWPVLKLRALACYESQIQEPSCAPWFLGEQWEYVPSA